MQLKFSITQLKAFIRTILDPPIAYISLFYLVFWSMTKKDMFGRKIKEGLK